MTASPDVSSFLARLGEVGRVLLAWLIVLLFEHIVVGYTQRALFSGTWEMGIARKFVSPIAVGALLPAAAVVVAVGHGLKRAICDGRARNAASSLCGVAAALVGYGVTFGRHFARLPLRVFFILLIATSTTVATWALLPRMAKLLTMRRRAALLGAAAATALWCMDAWMLPRLYPAFHSALFACTLLAAAAISLAWTSRWAGEAMVLVAALCVVLAPAAARRIQDADNLRLILVEHAPILGRAIRLAAYLAPPPPLDPAPADSLTFAPGEIPRALDWSGRDILLISVDALRADHVSVYGYGRRTTPHLDAIAREGAVFDDAYCPTPHTSYSITSMMTGKAMRPLLSLGLGEDSETWAAALRRYGYRTAGFYPPAVFFVDEGRFTPFESSGLDFEYRKIEFLDAKDRVAQVAAYLDTAPATPLFLWVHLFEPHEPYVMHEDHPFGGTTALPLDAYDSEIAEADDAVGRIVHLVTAARPGAVVIVTADHGEEFGDHGGSYHGTSCYEEQVRVPLIIAGPGVAPRTIKSVVQTIDLLPTTLSALGMPRPSRLRGRDLGPLLAGKEDADPGLAYAETDEYTMLARGTDRLVCARKVGACALFDVTSDRAEQRDRSSESHEVVRDLRRQSVTLERQQGLLEGEGGASLPAALRRGLQGDVDAAEDVAALLDDASVALRRKAAEVLFDLHVPSVAPQIRRASEHDEDDEVRRWTALAGVRIGEPASALADRLLRDPGVTWRRRAALAFAERGDARGAAELASWWADAAPPRRGLDVEQGKEVLAAISKIRDAAAVPSLLASFDFVPLRPWIADALGAVGDPRARAPLLAALRDERYVTARGPEAKALVALGVTTELRRPLARFAGIPEPMAEAIEMARDAKILSPPVGGISVEAPVPTLLGDVVVPAGAPLRLLVLTPGGSTQLTGRAGNVVLSGPRARGSQLWLDLPPSAAAHVALDLHAPAGLLAAWIVPLAKDVAPPEPSARSGAAVDAGRPGGGN